MSTEARRSNFDPIGKLIGSLRFRFELTDQISVNQTSLWQEKSKTAQSHILHKLLINSRRTPVSQVGVQVSIASTMLFESFEAHEELFSEWGGFRGLTRASCSYERRAINAPLIFNQHLVFWCRIVKLKFSNGSIIYFSKNKKCQYICTTIDKTRTIIAPYVRVGWIEIVVHCLTVQYIKV